MSAEDSQLAASGVASARPASSGVAVVAGGDGVAVVAGGNGAAGGDGVAVVGASSLSGIGCHLRGKHQAS